MDNCERCEALPEERSGQGTLYINSQIAHTLTKIMKVFDENDISYNVKDDELFHTSIQAERLRTLSSELSNRLTDGELRDTRALWLDRDRDFKISDLSRLVSLEKFLGRIDGNWLVQTLSDNRLFNEFHPILLADDPEEIHGYECLLRGRDLQGNRIEPSRIFHTAQKSDLMFQLDRKARILAVNSASELPVHRKIFINFVPTSIYDPEYCLRTTMQAVNEHELRKDQIVFEVVETEQMENRGNLIEILEYYREKGVNVALDDFGAGYSSISLLKDLEPDYIKLDMDLVQSVTENELQADLARNILDSAHENGIVSLAEGIETREEWNWFRDNGVDYVQGYYFAKPSRIPTEDIQTENIS